MTIETCEHRPSNGILGAPTIADLPPVVGQRALRPSQVLCSHHRVPPGVVDPLGVHRGRPSRLPGVKRTSAILSPKGESGEDARAFFRVAQDQMGQD